MRNPKNHNHAILNQALWIDCTNDMTRIIRHAARRLKPTHPSDSAYPLLYNTYFVPASPYMDFGYQEMYRCAQMQKSFVDSRFTYKAGNWNPAVNLFMDAPWRETKSGTVVADQSIASLILAEDRGRHHNGKSFQLFTKIQSSDSQQSEWHFQCRKEDT